MLTPVAIGGAERVFLRLLEQQGAVEKQFNIFRKQMTKVGRLIGEIQEKACIRPLDRTGKALPHSPAMKGRRHKN